MSIKKRQEEPVVSKRNIEFNCRASKRTILFSFNKITQNENYNFDCFKLKENRSKVDDLISCLFTRLKNMNEFAADQFYHTPHTKGGPEYLPVDIFKKSFINKLSEKYNSDDKLGVVRFNGKKCRLVFKRGRGCDRVFYILGIDCNLTLYDHGQ